MNEGLKNAQGVALSTKTKRLIELQATLSDLYQEVNSIVSENNYDADKEGGVLEAFNKECLSLTDELEKLTALTISQNLNDSNYKEL